MLATYRALRWATAILGLALPWVLWLGGRILAGEPLEESMSAYYYTGMRDELVGILFAVGSFLVVYRGYTWLENWALNLAGFFVAGVALFPTGSRDAGASGSPLHVLFAVSFFASIAYVCIFRASDTLALIHEETVARRFRKVYQLLGGLMILSPLLALLLALPEPGSRARSFIFFVEAVGVYVFAAYWIVKSLEIARTDSERLAVKGKLATRRHGLRDAFSRIPVERREVPLGEDTARAG
jgi:hypothetical protein